MPESLLDPRALRRISNLELVARRVVEGAYSGLHHSPFHGFSTDFLQHRSYVAGDDLRHLDWKLFGKTDRHYVREYEDDTNLRATIVLDASGSMDYASEEISKLHYAVRLAAAFAYLLVAQHDAVGLVVCDRAIRKRLPPRTGHRHLKHVLDELAAVQAGGETALGSVFHDLVPRLQRHGLVIILSDAFDEVSRLLGALAQFREAGHEVVLLEILDPREVDFSFTHWTRFECLEQSDERIVVDPAQVRQTYLERFEKFQEELRRGCHDQKVELVSLMTDVPYDQALASYLARREQRR